jgi:hypothetical protein
MSIRHQLSWNHERGATGSICKRVSRHWNQVERVVMAAMAGESKRDARGGDAVV